jgi:hypothetical protein
MDSSFDTLCWEIWNPVENPIGKTTYGGPLPYTNINSKWISDLNIKPNTTELPEENMGEFS